MSTEEKVNTQYDAAQIQVLEGLEAVRVRPRNVYCKYFTKRTSPFGLRNCGQLS